MKGSFQLGSLRAAFVLVTGLYVGQLAAAVSLGPIQVSSYLGQSLNASIALRGISDAEAADTRITLGDAAAYQARGIARTASQSSLRFTLVKAVDGYRILVTTNAQVREPFINFILSMKNAGNTINREYAVFLNPDPTAQAGGAPLPGRARHTPVLSGDKKLLTVTKNLPPPPNIAVGPAVQSAPRQQKSSDDGDWWESKPRENHTFHSDERQATALSQRQVGAKRASSGDAHYWQVKRGDTLYSIAAATLPASGISINAWMRALYRANRQAFIGNTMDKLILGSQLKISTAFGAATAGTFPLSANKAHRSRSVVKKNRKTSAKTGSTDRAKEKLAVRENSTRKNAGNPPEIDPNTPTVADDSVLPVEKKAVPVKDLASQEAIGRMEAKENREARPDVPQTVNDSILPVGQGAVTAPGKISQAVTDDSAATALQATAVSRTGHSQSPSVDADLRKETLLTLDSPQSIAELPESVAPLPESVAVPAKNVTEPPKHGAEAPDKEVREGVDDTVAVKKADSRFLQETSEEVPSGILAVARSMVENAVRWVTEKTAPIVAALPTQAAAVTRWASSNGPLGLPWWQIGALGLGIVLLLFVVLGRIRRKAAAGSDISKEELDRMVADMEKDDLFADSIQLSEQERATLDQVMVDDPGDETSVLDDGDTGTESAEEADFENQLLKDSDETGARDDPSTSDDEINGDFLSTEEMVDSPHTPMSARPGENILGDKNRDLQAAEDETEEDAFSLELEGFSLEDVSDESGAADFDDVTPSVPAESSGQPVDRHAPGIEDDNVLETLEEGLEDEENAFFADVSATAGESSRETLPGEAPSAFQMERETGTVDDDFELAAFPGETVAAPARTVASEKISEADEQAMEINLELAATYIESDVKPEKAKQWLNEVLRCGTQKQRDRAQVLLEKLK